MVMALAIIVVLKVVAVDHSGVVGGSQISIPVIVEYLLFARWPQHEIISDREL